MTFRRACRQNSGMRVPFMILALSAVLAGCGGGGTTTPNPRSTITPPSTGTPGPTPAAVVYQPLSVGDQWTYACGLRGQPSTFTITHSVTSTVTVNGQLTYAFALQIPSSPSQIATETMLLANDTQGNLILYGYLGDNGAVQAIAPTVIAPQNPVAGTNYNYPAPDGSIITRVFETFTATNPTPYGGVYPRVAVYDESGGTHNYGYAPGVGIAEEDHGPNLEYDCLISGLVLK